MKLTFLGTRGNTEARSERHYRHSALLVSYYGKEVMIDCGEDWSDEVYAVNPHAIVVTHAHPDHAAGLKGGAPCMVYATRESWEVMEQYAVDRRAVIAPGELVDIHGIVFEAFPVAHSTRAPAVGYRVSAGRVTIFYAPDVAYIVDRERALAGVDLYVGDGATITRSMIRKPGEALIGHAPVRTQLTWCQKERVSRSVFTHCGTEIVEGDPEEVEARVNALAEERGVRAEIAWDGLEMVLR